MPQRQHLKRKQAKDDVLCGVPEKEWYDASKHTDELHRFCRNWKGMPSLDCLDIFSFYQGMVAVCGAIRCAAYDIRLDEDNHDITSKKGVMMLLGLGMMLTMGALVTCAPPCSLHVWLSCSVHRRHMPEYGPYGNVSRMKVRLSNLIVRNMVGSSGVQNTFLIHHLIFAFVEPKIWI